MNAKSISVLIALTCIIMAGSVQTAIGAQFESTVDPNKDESQFKILYQRTLIIDYGNGGEIAEQMRGVNFDETFTTVSSNTNLDHVIDALNENILKDQSSARITDLDLTQGVKINGRADRASIDYRVLLEGVISNYKIGEKSSDGGISC